MPNGKTAGDVADRAAVARFHSVVWGYWKREGRYGLPWRRTKDPYKILVSEVMLQQTQVERVVPFYKNFLKQFPHVKCLASSSLASTLQCWSGLGYNRRARFLRDAAREIVKKHGGRVPKDAAALRALSGVGDYTAKAVRVFAWNEPEVLIETNIRTTCMHHFHSNVLPACAEASAGRQNVRMSDKEIFPLMAEAAKGQDPREWHWALMDYGAHLKKRGVRLNAKSAHYMKQSKFEGSLRQARGEVLRSLLCGEMFDLRGRTYTKALAGLAKDGLIERRGAKWYVAG
ncbi:hypothetical protein A3A34_02140 [Candidatus Kaiserbacteria bacterium RIFCSPLOWO2_01_FULL_50_24]|uniref:HhH-GPD domain-containing protein n=1 Tax=Candidatus Kaiserbacteria bacterium RIFCSPLOWO2_01_FULL_50_24 TaxID=1798507 RepID=A0A1F6ENE7_9BACT|nr:MAG: hypothetical protein A3A34_02140 [Candidatus Kaiserbacteria bacterium RIFCSPLOWO2_01_FULL_50_24]